MIFTSHDLAVVGEMASKVAVMRSGLVLESGSSSVILTHPQHAYTRSLLGAVPTLKTDRNAPLSTLEREAPKASGLLLETEPGHWVRQG